MKYDVVIKNVYVVHDATQKEVNIGINGNTIAYIGAEPIEGKETIDGKNHLAVPGWVNAHTHLAMTLLRSYGDDMELQSWLNDRIWPAEAKLTANDFKWGSYLGLLEMIKSGTTCFNDMYFSMDITAEATEKAGIRGVLSRCITVFDIGVKEKIKENLELHKNWHNKADGRIKVVFSPHSVYIVDRAGFKDIVEASKEYGVANHIHVSETEFEVNNCIKEHGMSPVAYLESVGLFDTPTVAAHCVCVDAKDIQIMAKHNVAVAHNPQSNLKLASGIAPITEMLSAGINVTVGTDGASSNNNLDMLEEVQTACLLAKGITKNPLAVPAETALQLGTVNGAKALGFDNLGKIEVGYLADLALYNMKESSWYPRHNLLSMLIYAGAARDVDTVLCNGKVIMKQGEVLTLDEEMIKYEAGKAGLDLVQRK